MIKRVVIKNFKKFQHFDFELRDHLVVAGPNNSGKTTMLQAIATWSEIASQWSEKNPDLARDNKGNYPATNLNSEVFYSVPMVDFDHLWKDKIVKDPTSVCLYTDQWKVEFEIIFNEPELAYIRPTKDVDENDLEKFIEDPLIPIYISTLSGVEKNESPIRSEGESPLDLSVIQTRLARGQAGSVLRNLLLATSRNAEKWKTLQGIVRSFFNFELDNPSAGTEIFIRYRHSEQGPSYDLSSAASGFLQVLLVYAALLHKEASVLLIDEPDAHLHTLLQEKMYNQLRQLAKIKKSQLIIATHSEILINEAKIENLRIVAKDKLHEIKKRKFLLDTLELENTEIVFANTEPGILYTEGPTDISILKEWGRILKHPLLPFLEKPFWRETSKNKGKTYAATHFSALNSIVRGLRGVELCDSHGNNNDGTNPSRPKGLKLLVWERYEIESYLIHPTAIARFVEKSKGRKAREKANTFMEEKWPTLVGLTAKQIIARIMNAAGIALEENEYYQIAAQMEKIEIDLEVVAKLNKIAQHFKIHE